MVLYQSLHHHPCVVGAVNAPELLPWVVGPVFMFSPLLSIALIMILFVASVSVSGVSLDLHPAAGGLSLSTYLPSILKLTNIAGAGVGE